MTEHERCLWAQALTDYSQAVAISLKVWGDRKEGSADVVPYEVIQSGAATVLIHLQKLRETHRASLPSPPSVAGTSGGQDTTLRQPPKAPMGVPPCPSCGGEMWDNRTNKKNPKSADFTCKQNKGECKNEKGFKTALWLKDLKPSPVMAQAVARSFDEMPAGLDGDAAEDDLPF